MPRPLRPPAPARKPSGVAGGRGRGSARAGGARPGPRRPHSPSNDPHHPPHPLLLAALALATAGAAEAIELPFQASTGSTVRKGSLPTSTSGASMSSYNMEGTKKRGLAPAAKKRALAKAVASIKAGQ